MTTLRTALRTFDWRQPGQQFRLFVAGLLLAIFVTGGILTLRQLLPAAPTQLLAGQQLSWEIAETIRRSPGVQLASGAYLPGDTLLLYSRLDEPDRARVRGWALMQLEPFRARLATMAKGETIKWIIDFGPAPAEQEVMIAPLNRAADATLYRYVSAAPHLLTADEPAVVANAPDNTAPAVNSNPAPTTAASNAAIPPVPAATSAPVIAASNAPTAALSSGQAAPVTIKPINFDDPVASAQSWRPLSGGWAIKDGIYSQQRTDGYDYISMLNLAPQTHYSMEAKLRLTGGLMGGGFVYNAPSANSRMGAQVVDLDKQGSFLRWGRYDAQGNYLYEGGGKVDPPINDGGWHTLQLLTHADKSTVSLDGRVMGQLKNSSTSGYLGLTTSQASVDFDDVTVTTLAPTADSAAVGNPISTTAANVSAPVALSGALTGTFSDDFANSNVNNWRVLNGTWQFVDETYQQLSIAGTDLGTISTFQGATYTVTVRLRQIEGAMGGGLYFNMAQRDAKMRSQMINYTRGGEAIQWGHFDEGGNFVFEDSAPVATGSDGKWHTLSVAVQSGKADFTLDGVPIAQAVPLTFPSGYVGLLVSASKVAFDDFTVVTPEN